VALFGLSLGALLFSSLAWVSALRLGATGGLLALWVVGTGQVVLLAEALSLLHQLDWPGFLVGHLLIAVGTAAWLARHPCVDLWHAPRVMAIGVCRGLYRVARDRRSPALLIMAGALLATGAICTAVALALPPSNADSLVYHMPRVGYYLQFRSLDDYPTMIPRQVFYPANAEILILWSVAFLRADRLANAVQLTAWVVTTAAVYGLGRAVGLGAGAAFLGAGLFALLPQAVLQTGSAHNDLVVASFLAASLVFLLWAARAPRPTALLALAGAAGGLALGTKGTAALALPGFLLVFVLLFGRRLGRQLLPGLLIGGLTAVLLGSYIYVQNWLVYGAPSGPVSGRLIGVGMSWQGFQTTWEGFLANLARTLWSGAFADLSGPLASRAMTPVAVPLARTLAAIGEWTFATLAIPMTVTGVDVPYYPAFSFSNDRAVNDYSAGMGVVGSLIVVAAAAALAWPRRVPATRRLLGLAALSYVATLALLLPWHLNGAGRFLLTGCALAAPLLGVVAQRHERSWRVLAVVLALWSGATGLYVAWANDFRPVARLTGADWPAGRDWLSLVLVGTVGYEPLFRAIEDEVGPAAAIAVTGALRPEGFANYLEYPFFGPRLARTVVPLVNPGYAQRLGLRRPPAWTNERMLDAYRPAFLAIERRPGAEALPDGVAGRCFELPFATGRRRLARHFWQLWRCDDRDPRNRVPNGDFSAWTGGRGAFFARSDGPTAVSIADGWKAMVSGGARLVASQLDPPAPGEEPFRLQLQYRASERGGGAGGEGSVLQELPLDDALRGALLVVDARLRADRPDAVVLRVDDGLTTTAAANLGTDPETLRVRHLIGERATRLRVALVMGRPSDPGGGRETQVLVRSVLAIPHPASSQAVLPAR
jgi:4-amino-4-deoxy-L-arabinose transferase-like glycosyltransferase